MVAEKNYYLSQKNTMKPSQPATANLADELLTQLEKRRIIYEGFADSNEELRVKIHNYCKMKNGFQTSVLRNDYILNSPVSNSYETDLADTMINFNIAGNKKKQPPRVDELPPIKMFNPQPEKKQ